MKASEATNQSRCATKMESDTGIGEKRHYLKTITGAIPFAFSVASVAFCILLGIQSNDIKNRMLDLESSNGARLLHPFAEVSIDEFNSMVQERVDEVLAQRSYVPFARVRTARQVSPDCNCPPGNDSLLLYHRAA
ncbi:Collagen alpha-1(XXV) chain [Bagarius yarrelli]|uniref:Collagen alpha-1(XXV) chain n=1 Tax=Bagarius yarrelli TaxID=175774 RepID=A0A556TVC8_BAGYA|nr:Collagen alpha-1(XXV) chain [Bagarius yarrelli]